MARIVIDGREILGSTGRVTRKLLEYLPALDTQNEYFVLLHEEAFDKVPLEQEKFHKVKVSPRKFTLAEQLVLPRFIKHLNPDLTHFMMTNQPAFMRSKRITTIHDLTPLRFSDPTANPIVYKFRQVAFRWLVKHVAKKSAVVLTGSEYTKTDIAQFASVSPSKIRVIPHAADHIEAQAQPIPNLGDSPFVFYVGRAQSHKNLERLIEAFTLLADSNPELKLVLAGKQDGNYGRLETIAGQSPVSDKIIFTGFISDAELKWLYENARAYVFPSLSEGFGLPGLEAMVHGCPVVSSNATCLPEVYGNAAVYFDPTSPEEMAKAIESVITDESLRNSLIEKGYRQAGKYSWQKTAEQTLAVYHEVLE